MREKKYVAKEAEENVRIFWVMLFMPILGGAIATANPELSLIYGVASLIFVVPLTLWTIYGVIMKKWKIIGWIQLHYIICNYVATGLIMVGVWRYFGAISFIGVLFLIIYLSSTIIPYIYRKEFFGAIWGGKGSKKIFPLFFGVFCLAALIAGGSSYASMQASVRLYGEEITQLRYSVAGIFVSIFLNMLYSGLWTIVKDEND
ncbi:hypothetical protein [Salipaludibacillus daqingensis]|uniref:hypothetical protein n=1 Tax=Salipaludibacillus daqingensis TaxID=3041001 RepID=UPI0024763CBE|nr:hypothetical protein [Salipaludibacillus daqingensis]